MLITRVTADLFRIPLPQSRALPRADQPADHARRRDHVNLLLVRLETDAGVMGMGFEYSSIATKEINTIVENEFAPELVGVDPTFHERIYRQLRKEVGATGGLAAVDLAIWDLKAKAAKLPLWQLLGGFRDSAPAYAADTAAIGMSSDQVLSAYESHQEKGIVGLHVAVGGRSPEADARKLEEIRNSIGLDHWLGVTAHGRYDAGTALAMGRFLEEEMDADWFEDPVPADDRAGLQRLADKLEVPVAAGSHYRHMRDFTQWLTGSSAGMARPDVVKLGGLTPALSVIALAIALNRPVVPVLLPEVAIHLACGLPGVQAVDYVGWLEPLWQLPPTIKDGQLTPPMGLGLGLELNPDAVEKFRVRP